MKFKSFLITGYLTVSCFAANLWGNEREYQYLDYLALEAGTDKSSAFHDYTRVYANYFSGLRDQPIKFLEIGIYKGDSVKMWENYFPKADLHFIDITNSYIQYHSSRSHYHFLDQSSQSELQEFIRSTGVGFDLIIDDGGHQMNQQITSFITLFPALKRGGIYVIEDLHTSYWSAYGAKGSPQNPQTSSNSTTEFLKRLVDDINYTGARIENADHEKTPPEIRQKLSYFQENILAIHFYKSLCIIIKR